MPYDKSNVIIQKTIKFSLALIKFCEALEQKRKYVIANQLLRAGTAIGANVFEAQHSESRIDFIHKIKIAAKEACETLYWLTLCEHSEEYLFKQELKAALEDIIRILSKIISTSKSKLTAKK